MRSLINNQKAQHQKARRACIFWDEFGSNTQCLGDKFQDGIQKGAL